MIMSAGRTAPVLLPDALISSVEQQRTVARLVRQCRELASGDAVLSDAIEPVAAACQTY
jgi:hypothetical protein